jgi:hypothetical protein
MSARLVRSAGCIGFVMFSDVFERFNAAKRAAQFFNATSTSSPFNPTTHGGYSPHSCALSRSTSLALRAIPDEFIRNQQPVVLACFLLKHGQRTTIALTGNRIDLSRLDVFRRGIERGNSRASHRNGWRSKSGGQT